MSVLVEVAAALADELAARRFGRDFTPGRTYDAEMELEALAALRVDVVPARLVIAAETAGSWSYDCWCDVAVRQKFAAADQEEETGVIALEAIDDLVSLVEEIHDALCYGRLAGCPQAVWQGTEMRAIYVPKHLREWRQFTGIVRVQYRVSQAKE